MLVVPELAHEMECLEVAAGTDTPVSFFLFIIVFWQLEC
jgi:hypothetical protein